MRRSAVVHVSSYGLSLLGKGIASAVLPLLVLDRTGDVLAAGVIATATTAASAATGLVSGLLVDRFDRRWVSVVSDLLAALSVASLPLIDAWVGLNMGWFLALGVLGAVIRVPGMTAHESLLPVLARLTPGGPRRLERLIAVREAVGNVLVLAGPGLGGLMVWLLGLSPALLLVNAATSLLGAALTLVLDPRCGVVEREPAVPGRGPVRAAAADLLVGWRFLARNRIVLGASAITAVFAAVMSVLQTVVMPAYFTGVGLPALAGLTLSALAAGSILGSALYAASAGRVSRRAWFVIGMLGTLTGFALLATLAEPWVVFAAAALVGLTNGPAGTVLGVLTVEVTPDAMRGRVLGAQNTLLLAAPALATAPLAALADAAGLRPAAVVLAVLVGATSVLALFAPVFRDLDPHADLDQHAGPEPAAGVPGTVPLGPAESLVTAASPTANTLGGAR